MASTADAVAVAVAPTTATAKVPPSSDKDCTIVLYQVGVFLCIVCLSIHDAANQHCKTQQGCSVAGDVTANLLLVTEAVKEAASAATGSHKAGTMG